MSENNEYDRYSLAYIKPLDPFLRIVHPATQFQVPFCSKTVITRKTLPIYAKKRTGALFLTLFSCSSMSAVTDNHAGNPLWQFPLLMLSAYHPP
jgi:hypothetical protein